ncbi:threonylcarbamoyl-AMP synthase [bacterium]|nr:threonylcarbamoyl-AMP synthase [Candidatus Omnitrophota bacterium]MBU2528815.1 threonylcarbamoyl-AMP synthase [bacterium]MBU3929070.1 threonylcarbamoyl-AMP synthase [bacterium]MBU4123684.1 threonylcarbamoyl-AMP synthase [bacterium]
MRVLKINCRRPALKNIKIAAQSIRKGKLVAFPTETVYGLGADALNAAAVSKIFKAKGRPLNDPLIVHIADKEDIFRLSKDVPGEAAELMKIFWPGPLTLVLKKSGIVPDIVSSGLDTVAVRMPSNPIAFNLIKYALTPVAAPSANLFGRPSPTCAQHVIDDLEGKIDILIDGGKTDIGVESTVIDMTHKPFRVLRPGGISVKELKDALGEIEINSVNDNIICSPGMLKHHYSPQARLLLFERSGEQIKEMRKMALEFKKQGKKVGIMTTSENQKEFRGFKIKAIGSEDDLKTCAFNLFSVLRSFDTEKTDIIIAGGIETTGLGLAVMDRLRRASSKRC